ncbi:Anaphase-promoting complex subunit 4 WD40 domain-containing protein [Plasmodiophora brassicae]|uniref:Uncharacterized protein n=1 Tax=Plasmodiophora brassicae TaxID=37360 RepID=A0A0G4IZY4_PLABS|nr:hypothetical protein PBRA_001693 [Plasmodiophora brassicae]SPQ93871.1 unnamed protein product [Plasmodiophora brassicae]
MDIADAVLFNGSTQSERALCLSRFGKNVASFGIPESQRTPRNRSMRRTTNTIALRTKQITYDKLPERPALRLGRPDVCPDGRGGGLLILPASHKDGDLHFLVADEGVCSPPIFQRLPAEVCDVHWVTTSLAVCAFDGTAISVFKVVPGSPLSLLKHLSCRHTDTIRELAICTTTLGKFASGGDDAMLCLNDIDYSNCSVACADVGDSISSVRWGAFETDKSCVTLTTELGEFMTYDTRTAMRSPVLSFNTMQPMLYAHSKTNDTTVVLGFGNGSLVRLDVRTNRCMESFDPVLTCIGDISYRPGIASNLLLSGAPGVSLWHADKFRNCSFGPWPSLQSTSPGSCEFTHAAWHTEPDLIVTTDSLGNLSSRESPSRTDRPSARAIVADRPPGHCCRTIERSLVGYDTSRTYALLILVDRLLRYIMDMTIELPALRSRKVSLTPHASEASTLDLGRPSTCPTGTGRVAFGASDKQNNRHAIALDAGTEAGVVFHDVNEAVNDLLWVAPNLLLCTWSPASASLMKVAEDNGNQLSLIQSVTTRHDSALRELAMAAHDSSMFASGGYDGKLCLNDFNFDRCTFAHTDIHDTISSVRWGQQMETDPHLVSLTTDSGDFMMFDTRVELNAVLNFSVVQMPLFSHARVDRYFVFLGFGDGSAVELDMRATRIRTTPLASYTSCIGDVQGIPPPQADTLPLFLISGGQGFSVVCRRGPSQYSSMFVSGDAGLGGNQACHTNAVWDGFSSTIISTDSLGNLAAYVVPSPVR